MEWWIRIGSCCLDNQWGHPGRGGQLRSGFRADGVTHKVLSRASFLDLGIDRMARWHRGQRHGNRTAPPPVSRVSREGRKARLSRDGREGRFGRASRSSRLCLSWRPSRETLLSCRETVWARRHLGETVPLAPVLNRPRAAPTAASPAAVSPPKPPHSAPRSRSNKNLATTDPPSPRSATSKPAARILRTPSPTPRN